MTPEAQARQVINKRLQAANWLVQDYARLNLGAAAGVAVREHPTDTGPADYVLYVHREAVGVIEAKRDDAGEQLVIAAQQAECNLRDLVTLGFTLSAHPDRRIS